ncbi:hypothetical protein [Paenirhodobacter sp. CAU 1674]|uniref:hypothetical protein n=1 Tax=Paenirhodobacter sp. CAU 1674 TaxID=3032596 RepID=UPI0023DCCA1A|nr:hypothetical protein [Paenirhodobacter sp. CAU 1674]MDF2143237.1 hypothetical protein [Paenirhodobacter sp. CAU 1674]
MRDYSNRINLAIENLIEAVNANNASGRDQIGSVVVILNGRETVGVINAGCNCKECQENMLNAFQRHISGEQPVAEYTHEIHQRH